MGWLFKKEHILEQIQKRYSAHNAQKELKRITDVLKDNVPDDWRLTRFSQDFLIRDLKTGITLVGHQERIKGSEEIWKSVNTALYKNSFSKAKIGKHSTSQYVIEIARRPNLIIGTNTEHEMFTSLPLMARQYEKVFYHEISLPYAHNGVKYQRIGTVKGPIEYYRLHSLSKEGLDRDKFIWAEWDATTGACIALDIKPPQEYHGEDFWMLQVKE